MRGHARENFAAVLAVGIQRPGLCADHGDREVDQPHEQAAEHARLDGVRRDGARLLHAEIADDGDDHDAERQRGQRIHRVVALKKACHKRRRRIFSGRRHLGDAAHGAEQRRGDERRQKDEKQRCQHLADPGENLAGIQRKDKHREEKQERENDQHPLGVCAFTQHALHADGEGDRAAARNSEKRPDGQIERAGEENAVAAANLAGQLDQAVAAADADGGHAEQRQTHAGNQETEEGDPHVRPGKLPHIDRENQVARAEEQTEQHTRDECQLRFRQFRFQKSFTPIYRYPSVYLF